MGDRFFTVVFPGAVEDYRGNPFLADTPFGRAISIGAGDLPDQLDRLGDAHDDVMGGVQQAADFLRAYFGPVASDDAEGWSDHEAREICLFLESAVADWRAA